MTFRFFRRSRIAGSDGRITYQPKERARQDKKAEVYFTHRKKTK